MDLIRIRNVEKKYKSGVTAIYDLNLAIEKGAFVFVIGGSGSGKSTLIKMLYREEKPTKGQIIVGGLDVAKLRNKKIYVLRRKLGIVFQNYRLLEKQTVYENVAFALEVLGEPKDVIRQKVLKALEDVGLKNKLHNYPEQLSGGEQQKVSIARALSKNCDVMFCDEPTGSLDSKNSKKILLLLEKLCREENKTIVIVTHNNDIVKMADRVYTMKNGKITNEKINKNPLSVKDIDL